MTDRAHQDVVPTPPLSPEFFDEQLPSRRYIYRQTKQDAYVVKLPVPGTRQKDWIQRSFKDAEFGGEHRAFEASRAWRNKTLAHHPGLSKLRYALSSDGKRRTHFVAEQSWTGITGVHVVLNRGVPTWVGDISPAGGTQRKKFSVTRHGWEKGFRQAYTERLRILGQHIPEADFPAAPRNPPAHIREALDDLVTKGLIDPSWEPTPEGFELADRSTRAREESAARARREGLALATRDAAEAQAAWNEYERSHTKLDVSKALHLSDTATELRDILAETLAKVPANEFGYSGVTRGGNRILVTASAQRPGSWQITRFDSSGMPSGDSQYTQPIAALTDFLREIDLQTLADKAGLLHDASEPTSALNRLASIESAPCNIGRLAP